MSKLIDAMKQVNDLNKTHGVTQRGGKKYTEVFVRVEAFRQAFGTDLGVETSSVVDDGKRTRERGDKRYRACSSFSRPTRWQLC